MRVTRADVARRAGVSPALVSYVLNPGMRPVAPATRDRILQAINELGYRPNAVAQSLRGGTTRSIGVLVPDLANPYFAELTKALEDAAFLQNHLIYMGSTERDPEREARYLQSFADRGVDAFILSDMVTEVSREHLASLETPILFYGLLPAPGWMSVVVDPSPGIREAAQHLHELGHRRTAVVGGSEDDADADRRVRAWCEAVGELGMDEPVVLRRPYTREGGLSGGQELLALGAPPTAILAASDVQGLGVLAAASRRGLRVPEDLSVVSIDGTLLAAYAQPPLTSVDQPLDLMAREAVGLVLDVAAGSDDGGAPRSIDLPTSFTIRSSTAGDPLPPT